MTASAQGPDTTLLVIAKQPVPGRVKTRLVPPFTHEQAAALAEAALADTLHTMLMAPARRRLLVLDGEPGALAAIRVRHRAAVRGYARRAPRRGLRRRSRPGTADRDGHPAGHTRPAGRGLAGCRRRVRPGRRRRILGTWPAGTGSRPAARRPHVNPEHRRYPACQATHGRVARRRPAPATRRGHGSRCGGGGTPGTAEPFRRTGAGIRSERAPGMRRDGGAPSGRPA